MPAGFNWATDGEAGDGIDSTGKIFAQALSRAGRHVLTSKDFASRIRGGYTAYKVRTAIDPVQSVVDRLDVFIALTQRTIDENLGELHEGSVIIYDDDRPTMADVEILEGVVRLGIPLKALAGEAGGAIMHNVAMPGATCVVADFPIENLNSVLQKRLGGKGEAIVENNRKAARAGLEYVHDEYDHEFDYDLEATDEDYVLIDGDQAIGMGAIAAGCRFYAGYPITPATDVMECLTGRIERYGGHVVQAEDELAAINLAFGAVRAGARSMTATSGPGIDLVAETFGLVTTSETPLVIVDVVRSGPSTGMPTKQERGDLNMMLYGGRGEIPRFAVVPTSIDECFWKTVEVSNFTEKYQVPVYVAADLAMTVTEQTFSPETFDMDEAEIDRSKVVNDDSIDKWLDEEGRFQPHALTNDGVSPCVFPGTEQGVHMSTGLERDKFGRRTEDRSMRVEQASKRDRKVETAKQTEDFSPHEFGDADSDMLIPSWGFNEGALVEALNFLGEDGIDVRFLSVPYMFPRPDLTEEIEAADEVIVVECSATEQFANVVEHDTLTRVKCINKYGGVRFKAGEFADGIKATFSTGGVSA